MTTFATVKIVRLKIDTTTITDIRGIGRTATHTGVRGTVLVIFTGLIAPTTVKTIDRLVDTLTTTQQKPVRTDTLPTITAKSSGTSVPTSTTVKVVVLLIDTTPVTGIGGIGGA